jgi:hypothetical protein
MRVEKIALALACAGALAGCDPQRAYESAVDQQMEQVNADADKMMKDIQLQVATDAVQQYTIVVQAGGSAIDRCVQAGMVAAAFLQAKAAGRYEEWKGRERSDCKAAGLPQ